MASAAVAVDDVQTVSLPLHVQRLQQLLDISPLLDHIESAFVGSEACSTGRYELYVHV